MEVFFLNAGKKWPNESLKVQASKIRRLAREANEPIPSDEEILQRFIKEGKIKAEPSYEKTMGAVDPVLRSDGKKYPPEERSRSISKSRHKHSPDQNDDTTNGKLIDLDKLPKAFRDFLEITATAQSVIPNWRPQDSTDWILKQPTLQQHAEILPYARPTFLTPRQIEILNSVQLKHTAVEGDRQTGKTLGIFIGIMEHIYLNAVDWIFVGATQETASVIFQKLTTDKYTQYLKPFYVVQPTATHCAIRCMDGSTHTFKVVSTTSHGVKGCTGGCWFDETDAILKDTPEVIGAGAALIRSNPDLHLVFSMNKGTGTYRLLLEKLQKWADIGKLNFLLLEKKDSYLMKMEEEGVSQDEFIADIMSVAISEEYALQQLKNIDTGDGNCFTPKGIYAAYDDYDAVLSLKPHMDYKYMGIDPSGTVHKHAYMIISYDEERDEIIEIESKDIRMGDGLDSETWSPERIEEHFVARAKHHNVQKVAVESNSGGQRYRIRLTRERVKCMQQNFKADNSILSRDNFIKVLSHFIEEGKIFLKNPQLKKELINYNPKVSGDEKNKGNIVDALIHAVWLAVGGVKYLMKIANANKPKTQTLFAAM